MLPGKLYGKYKKEHQKHTKKSGFKNFINKIPKKYYVKYQG
jgi:hypothetical protein